MVTTKSLLIHCNKLEEGMTTLLIYGRPKQKSLLTRKDAQSSLLDTEEKSKVHENFSFSIVLALFQRLHKGLVNLLIKGFQRLTIINDDIGHFAFSTRGI